MKNDVLCNFDSISAFKCFLFNLTVIGNLKSINNSFINDMSKFLNTLMAARCYSIDHDERSKYITVTIVFLCLNVIN